MRTRIVFLILLVLIIRNAAPFSVLDMPIPDKYKPGRSLPDDVRCNDLSYTVTDLFCYTLDYRIAFVYDRQYERIDRVTLSIDNYRIGDYILSWGTPDGVRRYTRSITQVMWGVRTVWVVGVFTPRSRVVLYEEYVEPPPSVVWEGFVDYEVFLTRK